MTVAAAPATRIRKPILAGDWLLYQHPGPEEPLPRCHLCGGPIVHRTRAIILRDQEIEPNTGPPLAHRGCAFELRRRLRHLHVL